MARIYICKADFSVTGINGTDDPSTATYDFQFDEEDYELIVDCELHNNIYTIILSIWCYYCSSSCDSKHLSKSL